MMLFPPRGESLTEQLHLIEAEEQRKSAQTHTVYFDKTLRRCFVTGSAILLLTTLLLAAFPQICRYIGCSYPVAPLLLGGCFLLVLPVTVSSFTKITYDSNHFTYTNPLGRSRSFRYDEVTDTIENGGLIRVVTDRQTILLFRTFYGVKPFMAQIRNHNSAQL